MYEELARKKLGTEDEPFEDDVPPEKITEEILSLIIGETKAGKKHTYVIDGINKDDINQMVKLQNELGAPSSIISLECDKESISNRLKKKLEIDDELGEEQIEEL